MEMKTKKMFFYQIMDIRWPMLIYYGVVLLITLLANLSVITLSASISGGKDGGAILSGLTGSSAIFLFIVGLNVFREYLRFGLQNGVSRKTLFCSRMLSAVTIAFVMGCIDQLVHGILALATSGMNLGWLSVSLFQLAYPAAFQAPVVGNLLGVLFNFSLLLAASSLGYMFVIVFYRLGKIGKLFIVPGIPVLVFFGLPLLAGLDDLYFGGVCKAFLDKTILPALQWIFAAPAGCMVFFFVLSAVFSGVAWLLMRKAPLR